MSRCLPRNLRPDRPRRVARDGRCPPCRTRRPSRPASPEELLRLTALGPGRRLREAVRRFRCPGVRSGPADRPRPEPGRGGRPGGVPGDLAPGKPFRCRQGVGDVLDHDVDARQGGGPGAVGAGGHRSGAQGRAGVDRAGRRHRRRGRRGVLRTQGRAAVPGHPHRTAAGVDHPGLLQRIHLPGGGRAADGGSI